MSKMLKALTVMFFCAASMAMADKQLGLMRPTTETILTWQAAHLKLPTFAAPPGARRAAGSVNLLPHLQYTAALRDQGQTGTCWIWATQGVMSIAYEIAHGDSVDLPEGFSTQFPASNAWMVGATLMSGGEVSMSTDFFARTAYTIPWSNVHAAWYDGDGNDNMKSSWIHTTPNVPIGAISTSRISTWNILNEEAIANIKAALDENKPVWLAWYMATDADWVEFSDFWRDQPETAIIQLDKYAGKNWDDGAGHAVVCVGYNDESADPAGHYWTILNSWGNADGRRPNGTFRMAMDMNYSATIKDETDTDIHMFEWHVIDTTFSTELVKGVKTVDFNYKVNAKSENDAISVSRVTFPAADAPKSVYSATLSFNRYSFICDAAMGTWTAKKNGFSFKSNIKGGPSIQIEIDTKNNVWSAKVNKAEIARYVNYYDGLMFGLAYRDSGGEERSLGKKRAFMFDELPANARGRGND